MSSVENHHDHPFRNCAACRRLGCGCLRTESYHSSSRGASGTILQVTPCAIAVKTGDGQTWTLTPNGSTKVRIRGLTELEMITPGTCVRFNADRQADLPGSGEDRQGHGLHRDARHSGADPGRRAGRRLPARETRGEPTCRSATGAACRKNRAARRKDRAGGGPGRWRPVARRQTVQATDPRGKTACQVRARRGRLPSLRKVVSRHGHQMTVSVQNRYFRSKITVELSADCAS